MLAVQVNSRHFSPDVFLVFFNDSGINVLGAGTNVNHCVNQSECSIERLLERLLEWSIEWFIQCFIEWLIACLRDREREREQQQHQHERQAQRANNRDGMEYESLDSQLDFFLLIQAIPKTNSLKLKFRVTH